MAWGGTVADLAALKARVITTEDDGLVLRVKNDETYQLDTSSSDPSAIAPDSGVGRWFPALLLTGVTAGSYTNVDLTVDRWGRITAISSGSGGSGTGKEVLSGVRTYYVSTSGSNLNNGLTSGTAFLTPQKAIDLIASTLDTNNQIVTIQLATATGYAPFTLKSFVGGGTIIIQGDSGNPYGTTVVAASGNTIAADKVQGNYSIRYLYLSAASGNVVRLGEYATVDFVNVGTEASSSATHIELAGSVRLTASGPSNLIGTSANRYLSLIDGASYALSGSLNAGFKSFTDTFIKAQVDSRANFLSGTITNIEGNGKRYDITGNSVVAVPGASATFLPGDIAGTTATGGTLA